MGNDSTFQCRQSSTIKASKKLKKVDNDLKEEELRERELGDRARRLDSLDRMWETATTETPTEEEFDPNKYVQTLDVQVVDKEPSLLCRDDGETLIYAGKVNWVSGHPSCGKSNLSYIVMH